MPEIGIDYGFFGRDKEDVLPMLCVKCRNSSIGCVGATVVDRKGASDYASSFLTAFIKSLRQRTMVVELDRTCDEQLDGCRVGADDFSRR